MTMTPQPPGAFQNPEVLKRLLFTFVCVTVYVIGRSIPVPGLHPEYLKAALSGTDGTSLRSVSIFGLGVAPYLGAAVLLSLLRASGRIEALAGRDAAGRRAIYRAARPLAAVFAVGQAALLAIAIERAPAFILLATATFAAGAMFVLWLAEEISENGIGSGMLLILFVDIAAKAPGGIAALNALVGNEDLGMPAAWGIAALVVLALSAAVFIETAQRKIPVQYAKRVIGRMMVGGQQMSLPVKVNPAGALALIAAATAAAWPAALSASARHPAVYFPLFAALVFAFSRLYRTSGVEPRELAGQIQQNGGFIVGTRSGDAMFGYFSRLLERLADSSAVLVAAVAVAPAVAVRLTGSPATLDTVSVYLLAAVALDFVGQVQARAMMRNFGGGLPKSGGMTGGGIRPRSSKRRKRR